MPSFFWPGLRDVCEWVTPELARWGGWDRGVRPQEAGCNILLAGNEVVQVTAVGPYDG